MTERRILGMARKDSRRAIANIVLIANAFVWYLCAFGVLKAIVTDMKLDFLGDFTVWGVNFGSAALSALVGALLAARIRRRTVLLTSWILIGVLSSIALMLVGDTVGPNILVLSVLLGVSFGSGMPLAMGNFTDTTDIEKRGRLGGLIMLTNFAGTFLLLAVLTFDSIFVRALILAAWRALGLIFLLFYEPQKSSESRKTVSYLSILSQRSFLYYFIPWITFSLASDLSTPLQITILGEALAESLMIVENVLTGVFAVVGGFLIDFFGRKRMSITGFVILGLGYAILGVYPESVVSWYFYTVVDGVAWGIFFTIFFMTIWGDLSSGSPSEKHYALGGLPYLLSTFLRLAMAPYITEAIPAYAVFSFGAFFLFLAVLPLTYATETLPEKSMKDRELKKYLEKAKKAREKYS